MIIFEKFQRQNRIKIHTKTYHFKNIFWGGGMHPNPPSKAHGFDMRSMSLRDMQISKSEKRIPGPPPKSWLRPCILKHSNDINNASYITCCNVIKYGTEPL